MHSLSVETAAAQSCHSLSLLCAPMEEVLSTSFHLEGTRITPYKENILTLKG